MSVWSWFFIFKLLPKYFHCFQEWSQRGTYYFACVKTFWQNCMLVQVRHMETHHRPHQRTQGATPVSWHFRVLLLLANTRGTQLCASTKCLAPALRTRERMSNTLLPALLLAQVAEVPTPPWKVTLEPHTQHNLWPGGGGTGFLVFDTRKWEVVAF